MFARVVHILVRTSLQESLLLQKEKLLNAYLVLGGNTKVFQRKWMHLDVKSCNQSVDKTTKILSDSPLRYANKQYADDDDDERDEGISSNYEDIPFAQQRLFMKVRPETEVDVDESTFKIVVLERDLEKLDDCNLIDLILLRFELIHYLNASENQGPQLTNYFRSSDLNQQLKLHSQRVSKVFGVRGAKLKPLHPNLFSTATQLYFRKFQLDHLDGTAESFEFVEQIVFESGRFCKSYEMHCLIRYFVQKYIEMYGERHSLFYDELLTFDLAAIEQKMNAFNLQKVTPASPPTGRKTRRLQAMAPKKSIRYQMDELKEYVEDLYRTDRMGISGRKTTPEVLIIDSSSDDDDVVLITKPQPLTAKKNHKSICRTTRSQSHLTVKKEVDENDDESNENRSNNILTVVEKKTRPKCRIELSPQKNESIEDCLILFDKLNLDNDSNDSDTPLFKRKTNEQTHEKFLRQMLRDLLALFAFSPPIDLHLFMSSILFRMHLTSKRSDDNVAQSAYHFTEMVTGNSLRYQTIRTHQNRSTVGIQSFDTKHLKFECEEKVFDGQLTQLMRSLPSGWRAIQIQQILKPNQTIPDLYVCRVEPDVKPIMIKIKANPTKVID